MLVTIHDAYKGFNTEGGIFSFMPDVGFLGQMTAVQADMMYILLHSKTKEISPFLNDVMVNEEWREIVSNILYNMFNTKWTKLYETTVLEYDPIENYNMEETTEEDSTVTDTYNTTDETNSTSTSHTANDGTTDTSLYGFNSDIVKPSDKVETTLGSENEATNKGTNTKTGTVTNARDVKHTLTRHGNIGVTTSQQMIQSEREVLTFNYLEEIFHDIDTLLAISTY